MLMLFIKKIRCAFILLKVGALKVFFYQLRRQIYSRDMQIGLVKALDGHGKLSFKCQIKYRLQQASEEDMNEAFQKVKTESQESAQKLLNRKWLYECGCGKWYIARTADTDELCYLQCIIRPQDNKLLDKDLKNWFPKLKEDEILLEGAYTLENYRRKGVSGSVLFDILEIYRKKGFKRLIGYIDNDRKTTLENMEAIGFTKFEEITLHKTLFFTKRKYKP